MLTKLTPTTVTNKCLSIYNGGDTCNLVTEIAFSSLVLGKTAGPFKLKDYIVLPQCARCTAVETLVRFWGTMAETNPSYKTKAAINFLGKKLKEASQLDPGCASAIMAETSDPSVILADYPPGDGTI